MLGSLLSFLPQVLTRLLVATLHTLTAVVIRAADDVLAVGRHRHRIHMGAVPLEGVDVRPVDVVQPDLLPKADHKVHAVGQRRDAIHPDRPTALPTSNVRSSSPPKVNSFAVPSFEPLTKRAPPGSTATAVTSRVCASMVRTTRRRATP